MLIAAASLISGGVRSMNAADSVSIRSDKYSRISNRSTFLGIVITPPAYSLGNSNPISR